MIARLSGILLELDGYTAVIAPEALPGLAYEAMLPAYLARTLAERIGEPVGLHTIEYLEGQNQGASFIPRLIGFADSREREFFELLTSVKGLGNKRALRAMAVEPATIARAIAERDTRFLQRLPEIGPKLAELIVHELKTKADKFALSAAESSGLDAAAGGQVVEPKPKASRGKSVGGETAAGASAPAGRPTAPVRQPPIRQTVDALIALGESPIDAERMVARAIDAARAGGRDLPSSPEELLSAAYASK